MPGAERTTKNDTRSIEQRRIAAALAAHDAIASSLTEPQKREYVSNAKGAPPMIRTIGLGPAIATLAQRGGGARLLADAIASWIVAGCPHLAALWPAPQIRPAAADARAFLLWIGSAKPSDYRCAQDEAIAYGQWLKRFADAFLGDSGS